MSWLLYISEGSCQNLLTNCQQVSLVYISSSFIALFLIHSCTGHSCIFVAFVIDLLTRLCDIPCPLSRYVYACLMYACIKASTPEVLQLNPWHSCWPVHEFTVNRSYAHQALGIWNYHVSVTNQT